MSEVFRVDIEDTTGSVVATIKAPQYLSFETKIGRRGALRLQLHFDDPLNEFVDLDYITRVWYKNPIYDIDWTNVYNGIVKTPSHVWYSNGNKLSTYFCSDSMELIDKALIMYPISNQTRAYKSGIASDVMTEYILENVGANALVAEGRYVDHVNPITVNSPSPGVGPNWEGNAGHDVLMKVLQDIRAFSHQQNDRVDFNVVYSGDYTWLAQVGKIFSDRTINGLDSSTGLNAAGNFPIILSPLYGNVEQYTESIPRQQESNIVIVLGQRVGEDREVYLAADTSSLSISPIAQRESLAQTQNQDNLQDYANAQLNERVGRQDIVIEPKFTNAFALFRDLVPGDFFTAVALNGTPVNKQIIELRVVVQQTEGGRTISQYTMFTENREP